MKDVEREMKEEVLRQQYNLNQYEFIFFAFVGIIMYPIVLLFDFLDDVLEVKRGGVS